MCNCKECREHGETLDWTMSLTSYVKDVPGAKDRASSEKLYPCGHTEAQAHWLGCTQEKCRAYDEAQVKSWQAWVKMGKPMPGGQPQ